MEQRDYIIIGLCLLVAFQFYEIIKLKKEAWQGRVGIATICSWLEEVHKIKIPSPDSGDKDFERILKEVMSCESLKRF